MRESGAKQARDFRSWTQTCSKHSSHQTKLTPKRDYLDENVDKPTRTGESLKLILDVATRWNSSLDMLERYLKPHPAVCSSLAELKQQDLLLSHMTKVKVDVLENACKVLKPLKEVTVLMSSETSTTASLLRPLLHSLMLSSKPTEHDEQPIHQAKANLYHDLEKRCSHYSRTRGRSLVHLAHTKQQQIHEEVLNKITPSDEIPSEQHSDDEEASSHSENVSDTCSSNVLATILSSYSNPTVPSSTTDERDSARIELQAYLKSPPCSMDTNPLVW